MDTDLFMKIGKLLQEKFWKLGIRGFMDYAFDTGYTRTVFTYTKIV